MVKLQKWFKKNISFLKTQKFTFLDCLSLAFIFFIPLWPKLPIKTIEYTYIAVRWEDFFIAFLVLIYFLYLLFKKVNIRDNPLFLIIPLYWLVVFAAYLYGFYVLKSVKTLELGFLNAARRVEYMIVFFIGYSVLKNKEQLYFYLKAMLFVVFIVSIYGIGQKFLGWPAVQTMNPHYSKGYLLILDATARISSTFSGHYDLAAYLIFFVPLILAMYLVRKHQFWLVVYTLNIFALVLTASRTAFVAYFVVIIPFLLYLRKYKLLFFSVAVFLILTPLSSNLTQRIKRTFQTQKIWYNVETGNTVLPRDMGTGDVPPGDYLIGQTLPTIDPNAPAVKMVTEQELKEKLNVSDDDIFKIKKQITEQIRDEAKKSGKKITQEEIDRQVNAAFANLKPVQAVVPDISISTRLQVEWPRAVKAAMLSPILGTGPSSITEATDNNYLRELGETGLLGFTMFFGIILYLLWIFFRKSLSLKKDTADYYFLIALLFACFGLLINAIMVDILESSKVAFYTWFIWGLSLKYCFDFGKLKKKVKT